MFYPTTLIARAKANVQKHDWAAALQKQIIEAAQPWLKLSDDELWELMFGNTIRRSWMVWSNGHCPSCQKGVPMYEWRVEALDRPWKTWCPHCQEAFPKNDFHRFYRSGLDEQGVFDPARADRTLLVNEEHPDPSDPLHRFGVDDGEGYVDGQKRWRFIGAYLIYGQWKQAIVGGIRNCSAAYLVSGDPIYAHKAAVLLDRVADLYPTHDFGKQGVMYEGDPFAGYVSTWHDACEETREIALAYDRIREAIDGDDSLVGFLSQKAAQFRLANPKTSAALIRQNIEDGTLRHPVEHRGRIYSNYPRTEVALIIMLSILDRQGQRQEVARLIGEMVSTATAVDGVTGEKGLTAYSAGTIDGLAHCLALFSRIQPSFLSDLLAKYPALRQTYRFHIDTWFDQRYYPSCGDAGGFAQRTEHYCGASFRQPGTIDPSMFTFFWQLYQLTGDAALVQVLYHENGGKLDGLPHDLFAEAPEAFQREVAELIQRVGPAPKLRSINKESWHLAILRSGERPHARSLWLDYDSGGRHSHADGMNLGLFAKGLDLMPDLGYPPVQYGGWSSPRALWYRMTAAHNTVVVDGQDQFSPWYVPIGGEVTLCAEGEQFRAIGVNAPDALGGVVPVTGSDHEMIGVYFHRPASLKSIRVLTKADDALAAPWTLRFEDDFRRHELGADWRALDGEWAARDGQLTGRGSILCTRRFPGCQRVEFEAVSGDPSPCDLSVFLCANEKGYGEGALFGFGSQDNTCSRLLLGGVPVQSCKDVIVPGRTYRITCERDGAMLSHSVDGRLILSHRNQPAECRQFERLAALIDLSERDSYVLDIFRVVGGKDHAKFQQSHFGALTTEGLALAPAPDYGHDTQMRHFRLDPSPAPAWSADWKIEDRLRLLPAGSDVHLRHIDLTNGAQAGTCEAWISVTGFGSNEETWIPRLMVRRQSAEAPLSSTFVAVIEPYEKKPSVMRARRLVLQTRDARPFPDGNVAVEVELADGRKDLLIFADVPNALGLSPSFPQDGPLVQKDWDANLDGEGCWIRQAADGVIERVALWKARFVEAGPFVVRMKEGASFAEVVFQDRHPQP